MLLNSTSILISENTKISMKDIETKKKVVDLQRVQWPRMYTLEHTSNLDRELQFWSSKEN